ncbi:MAG TPA: MarR family transcriptional regulator [Tepidiformaceae bacterium]|nr:MarR family transcriptional regulator [Tepidiformaceae bacterium]HMO94970.1 MarR family transcriptional regulator [Tepidiformaceae bacterium]
MGQQEFPMLGVEARARDWMVTRGLDPIQFEAAYNTISAGQVMYSSLGEAMAKFGFTYEAWRILWLLDLVKRSEPRRIAQSLWLSRPAVIASLNKLESEGLVSRNRAANDRRLVLVELTERGRERLEEALPAYLETVRRVMEPMSQDELRALGEVNRKFWILNYEGTRKSAGSPPRIGPAMGRDDERHRG